MEKTLKQLILENPNLPIIISVCGENCDFDEANNNLFFDNRAEKVKIYRYTDAYDDTIFYYSDDLDYIDDYYSYKLADTEEYENLSDNEFDKAIQDFMKDHVKSFDAIVIYADND